MDATWVDGFTRRFANRLGRRQFLGGLAAAAGITAARRSAAAPQSCPSGWYSCSARPQGCCRECDPPHRLTCGTVCFDPSQEYQPFCADFDHSLVCQARPRPEDPSVTSRVCYFGPTNDYPQCVLEPPGCAPYLAWHEDTCSCQRCDNNSRDACNIVCCAADEECVDGACVARCDWEQRHARQLANAADSCTCPAPGMFICKGQCVQACPGDQILNPDTCACDCLGDTCGNICCPLGQECASDGGGGFPSVCCPRGESCAGQCLKPGQKCCRSADGRMAVCPKQTACCFAPDTGRGRCCGNGQKCQTGKCVKKKRGKR